MGCWPTCPTDLGSPTRRNEPWDFVGVGRNRATGQDPEAPGLEARGGCLCEPHGESGALGDQPGRSRLRRGSLPPGAVRGGGSVARRSAAYLCASESLWPSPKKNIPPTKAAKRSPEGRRGGGRGAQRPRTSRGRRGVCRAGVTVV